MQSSSVSGVYDILNLYMMHHFRRRASRIQACSEHTRTNHNGKHLQHQKELFHNLILDLKKKKTFDRVCHDGLWHALRAFGIEETLAQIMKSLYSSANCAVLLNNNNTSEYFKTTVCVRQGCLLFPVLFNLYVENIVRETLHNFKSSVSIG